jgi:hypothetical protein
MELAYVLLKSFWVVARHQFLVYNQQFGNVGYTTTAEAFNYILAYMLQQNATEQSASLNFIITQMSSSTN